MYHLKFVRLLENNNRPKIVQTIETILDRYSIGETMTSVAIPPRYGKSAIIQLSALELSQFGAPTSVVLSPWDDLADQIKDPERIKKTFQLYGIPEATYFSSWRRESSMRTHVWFENTSGIPNLISMTNGLVSNAANKLQFLDGIAYLYEKFQRRIPIFGDESHMIRNVQQWANLMRQAVERGAYFVPLTGTPIPGMLGYDNECSQWEECTQHIPRSRIVDGEKKYFVEYYEGKKRKVNKINADASVTWDEAWSHGALARTNWSLVDVDIKETKERLSTIKKSALGGKLKHLTESDEVVNGLADKAIERFLHLRRRRPTKDIQMLVVTGYDIEVSNKNGNEDTPDKLSANRHAKQFRRALIESLAQRGLDPDVYSIKIVTGVTDAGPNKEASDELKKFRKGKIDIMIVKIMGIVGLDVATCKVIIWGSTIRRGPLARQGLTRVCTILSGSKAPGEIIAPADALMQDLKQNFKNCGGIETDLEFIDEQECLIPPIKDDWSYVNPRIYGYIDEMDNLALGDHDKELFVIKEKYDTGSLTDAEIIKNFLLGAFPLTQEDYKQYEYATKAADDAAAGIVDLNFGLAGKRGRFGPRAREIANRHVDYIKEPDKYRKKVTQLQARAKEMCGVLPDQRVNEIDDVALLDRLFDALSKAEGMIQWTT